MLVVSQSQPKAVMPKSIPFPVACDPERNIYRAFGLEPGRWTMFFRSHVIGHYLKLIFKGWLPHMSERGEDLLQLGGDFIVSTNRQLVYAYRSRTPDDRPTASELLRQLRLAHHSNGDDS